MKEHEQNNNKKQNKIWKKPEIKVLNLSKTYNGVTPGPAEVTVTSPGDS